MPEGTLGCVWWSDHYGFGCFKCSSEVDLLGCVIGVATVCSEAGGEFHWDDEGEAWCNTYPP